MQGLNTMMKSRKAGNGARKLRFTKMASKKQQQKQRLILLAMLLVNSLCQVRAACEPTGNGGPKRRNGFEVTFTKITQTLSDGSDYTGGCYYYDAVTRDAKSLLDMLCNWENWTLFPNWVSIIKTHMGETKRVYVPHGLGKRVWPANLRVADGKCTHRVTFDGIFFDGKQISGTRTYLTLVGRGQQATVVEKKFLHYDANRKKHQMTTINLRTRGVYGEYNQYKYEGTLKDSLKFDQKRFWPTVERDFGSCIVSPNTVFLENSSPQDRVTLTGINNVLRERHLRIRFHGQWKNGKPNFLLGESERDLLQLEKDRSEEKKDPAMYAQFWGNGNSCTAAGMIPMNNAREIREDKWECNSQSDLLNKLRRAVVRYAEV